MSEMPAWLVAATAASTQRGFSVSYRQHWWNRRRYVCGNVPLDEAWSTTTYLLRVGRRRIRIEPT